ncbi:MAG: hypothetical protein AAFU67_08905 [Bacteroidota bacterium]
MNFNVVNKVRNRHFGWLLVIALLFLAADAPTYRLRNFERAPGGGYGITSDSDGVAQWSQSVNGELNVNLVPVSFTPTTTGNTSNLNESVIDPSGTVWIIDSNGDAILVEQNVGQLEASEVLYDGTENLGQDVADALDELANRINQIPNGSSGGTTSYRIDNTDIIYVGDASIVEVTHVVTAAGAVTFTIPEGVYDFSITVPRSVVGLSGTDDVTATFVFPNIVPFNQSENTMRYPTAHLFSRATESSNGFDVELRGNNPQSRLLPFTQAGNCSHQFGGVSTAGNDWTISYSF